MLRTDGFPHIDASIIFPGIVLPAGELRLIKHGGLRALAQEDVRLQCTTSLLVSHLHISLWPKKVTWPTQIQEVEKYIPSL